MPLSFFFVNVFLQWGKNWSYKQGPNLDQSEGGVRDREIGWWLAGVELGTSVERSGSATWSNRDGPIATRARYPKTSPFAF